MKKFGCLSLVILLFICFCGCDKKTEVETVYEEVVSTNSQTTSAPDQPGSSIDVSSQPTGSSAQTDTPTSDSAKPDEQPDNTVQEGVYMLNDESVLAKVKLNGRCEKTIIGVSLGMSGSAIEFNTTSSAVMLEANCAAGIYYNIVVDGVVTYERQVTESGTNYIILARNLSSGTHNIKLIRDCEGRTDMRFNAVSLQLDDGELLARDTDKVVIEFLGDSITGGFGNLIDNGVSNPLELKNQSVMKAYPYLVASKHGYDYRIVAQSGIALAKREGYLPFIDYYKCENYHLDKNKEYTSSSPKDVDIVVVNLGTNDIGSELYDTENPEHIHAYEKYYADLITSIGYNKDTKILFVSGVWYNDPAITDGGVVKELNSRGYNNVYTMKLNKYKSGGGSHPSGKEHQEIANLIINYFKSNGIA